MTNTVKNTSVSTAAAKPTSKPTASTKDTGKVRVGGGTISF